MKKFAKTCFCIVLFFLYSKSLFADSIWIIDQDISEIKLELPILLGDDIYGKFTEFDGNAIINQNNDQNNSHNNSRIVLYVQINSLELDNNKHKEFLLSDIFFDAIHFPVAIIDTKKFTIVNSSNNLNIKTKLQIKNLFKDISSIFTINKLANNLIQIKGNIEISRTSFKLGENSLLSKLFFGKKMFLNVNLFLNKE